MEEEYGDSPQKEEILARMPGWEYDFSLSKIDDNGTYAVFLSQDYVYMGGAHGGVTGAGCLTFDKRDGSRIEAFLDPDCVEDIQPLLREGLVSYFSDFEIDITEDNLQEFLLLDGDLIPLPAWQPYPSEDGLVFTYQQYEIAPYAAGMPSFVLPLEGVAPYLTNQARSLLNL